MTVATKEVKANLSTNTDMERLNKVFIACPNLRVQINRNKQQDGRMDLGNGYTVKISNTVTGNHFSTLYNDCRANMNRQKADVNDVLYCLLLDRSSYISCRDFYDFCDMFGYTKDTILGEFKARKVYNACKLISDNLEKVLTSQELEELQEVFQDF